MEAYSSAITNETLSDQETSLLAADLESLEMLHPIHYAAAMGSKRQLINLLKYVNKTKKLLEERDRLGRTALTYATISGKCHCVEILLKAGSDINALDLVRF